MKVRNPLLARQRLAVRDSAISRIADFADKAIPESARSIGLFAVHSTPDGPFVTVAADASPREVNGETDLLPVARFGHQMLTLFVDALVA